MTNNNQGMDEIFYTKHTYQEYTKQAKKLNAAILSELEWLRVKAEKLAERQESLLKREETLLSHEENISKRQVKSIDQILKIQEVAERKDARFKREMSEAFKSGIKDFLGIRQGFEASKNPFLASSSMARTTSERLMNFEELPPIFKDIQKGIFGSLDLVANKLLDPLLQKTFGSLFTAGKVKVQEGKDKKFLLENDPRFRDKERGKEEVNAFVRERKQAIVELKNLEEKQAKLSEYGGYDLKIAEEIKSLKDWLSGNLEREDPKKPEPEKQKKSSTQTKIQKPETSQLYSIGLPDTVENNQLAIITNIIKLDNRLASIKGDTSSIVSLMKQQALVAEESTEEASRVPQLVYTEREDNKKIKDKEEGSGFGVLTAIGGIVGGLSFAFEGIVATLKGIVGSIGDFSGLMKTGLKLAFEGATTLFGETLKKVGSVLSEIFGWFAGKIKNVVLSVGSVVAQFAKTAGTVLANFVKMAGPAAAGLIVTNVADYGLGKLGVGKDEEGNQLSIDEEQDEANWKKMSFLQKAESGLARSIESVGSFVGLSNVATEAEATRIKKETEFFKSQEEKPKSDIFAVSYSDMNREPKFRAKTELQPIERSIGTEIETYDRKIRDALDLRQMSVPQQPIIVAPSSSSTVNNTTAVGLRPRPRHAESTLDRIIGDRYANSY